MWMVMVVFFASLMHWAEFNSQSVSIPLAIYWAIITMTTVGYGDIYPNTPSARFFGALCAYTGYVMAALPIAVLVTKLAQCEASDEREAQSSVRARQGKPPPDYRTESAEMVALTRD